MPGGSIAPRRNAGGETEKGGRSLTKGRTGDHISGTPLVLWSGSRILKTSHPRRPPFVKRETSESQNERRFTRDDSRPLRWRTFSAPCHHEFSQQLIALVPLTMPALCVDMSRLADIDEPAPPGSRTVSGMGQRSERIVPAGDHQTPKGEGLHRHRLKPASRGGETFALRVWHRHEKSALYR